MTYDYDGTGRINRIEGVTLVVAYFAYIGYVVVQNV
jgi:hypothetical protein